MTAFVSLFDSVMLEAGGWPGRVSDDAGAESAVRNPALRKPQPGRRPMRRMRAARVTAARDISKPDEQWRQELSPQQYYVLRRGRTEPAFTGQYVQAKENGSYCCAGCGNELFRSDA